MVQIGVLMGVEFEMVFKSVGHRPDDTIVGMACIAWLDA